MKIALVIYIISWLILLAIYLSWRKENDFSMKETGGLEKGLLIFIFLLAPLFLLFVPYFIYSNIRDKRKSQKASEERNRKEKEESEYRSKAFAAIRQAKLTNASNGSSDFQKYLASLRSSSTTDLYTQMQDEKNYPMILKLLPKLSLPEGASLHVEKCKQQGSGDKSTLFVQTHEGTKDYEIWDYISVEHSVEGAWNAYILYNLWHVLPMFWHALYERRFFLFFQEFTGFVDCLNKKDTESVRTALKQNFISPDVVYANEAFYVSCSYFSNFGGLIQETIEIKLDNGKASFQEIERKPLFEYDCGIRF